ncbi:hypothetical protein H8S47_05730 [Sphingomonas sp. DOAB1063]|uniref:Uncharacterized protein n=1 Tax=Sphingomonas albertensis TaxID=2762591 RepID=A0ABR7AL40_9SPHN|nr:hypothetical protein [Sphingomonas albertensis]
MPGTIKFRPSFTFAECIHAAAAPTFMIVRAISSGVVVERYMPTWPRVCKGLIPIAGSGLSECDPKSSKGCKAGEIGDDRSETGDPQAIDRDEVRTGRHIRAAHAIPFGHILTAFFCHALAVALLFSRGGALGDRSRNLVAGGILASSVYSSF